MITFTYLYSDDLSRPTCSGFTAHTLGMTGLYHLIVSHLNTTAALQILKGRQAHRNSKGGRREENWPHPQGPRAQNAERAAQETELS